MSINVSFDGSTYSAVVTAPEGHLPYWKSEQSLSAEELIADLKALGCHQTDIGDAFCAANPDWLIDEALDRPAP